MTYDFKKHAECRLCEPSQGVAEGVRKCNADRALLIAEGERLQAELVETKDLLAETQRICRANWDADLEIMQERDRLKEQIALAFVLIANAYDGNWDDASDEWRQAARRWRDWFAGRAEAALNGSPEGK